MTSLRMRTPLVAALLVGASAIALPLLGQEPAENEVAREDRYLLNLATCRPSYRPGDEVRVRGLLLHALTRQPHGEAFPCKLEVRSPRGDVVGDGAARSEGASLGFSWPVPADAAGGVYTLTATPGPGYPPAEVSFEVRAYRVPRLKTELEFVRKAYGPGDEAAATLLVTRAEGGVPAGARATCVARIDGRVVHREVLTLDDEGKLLVRFTLPEEIETPDATLAIVIEDGGVQETAARTIPIVLSKLRLTLFPEGGDLVAGLRGRVYFEARTLTDDPADVRGRVVDERGAVIARLESVHEGRGRFELTPEPGRRYHVVLDAPAGVTERFALPKIHDHGLVLTSPEDAVAPGAPLRVRVAGTVPPSFAGGNAGLLTVSVRDRQVAMRAVVLDPNGADVEVPLPLWAAGALRVTLSDAGGTPRAERLVFRRPPEGLKVQVTATPAQATPGAPVTLRVVTTDAAGEPVDALVGLSVVDDATLKRVRERDRAPRLPTQVLLGNEVRELKDAHLYLDDSAQGPVVTDLLLGTQGWRRFAWKQADAFVEAHGDDARRVLAQKGPELALFDVPQAMAFGGARFEDAEGRAVLRRARPGAPPPAPPAPAGPVVELGEVEVVQEGEPEAAAAPAEERAPAAAEAKAMNEQALDMDDARAAAPPRAKAVQGRARRAPAEPMGDEARAEWAPPPPPASGPFRWVREFAHQAAGAGRRSAFLETVYWNPGVRTGAKGAVEVTFALSDSVTTFRALVDAVAPDGSLAWGEAAVEARRPFYVEPKMPLELTSGDRVQIPVALVNGTTGQATATIEVEAGDLLEYTAAASRMAVGLAADERGRVLLPFTARAGQGEVQVRLTGSLGRHGDEVIRTLRVVPRGFPIEHAWGGRVSADAAISRQVSVPEQLSPGSLEATAVLYPTPLAALTEALAALLREPNGCFEQTSSTNYPNVMAMRYMQSHTGVDPALVARTSGLLERGYAKLVSFECEDRGYEWFGGDPGHEALTAYGLLEFTDMAACMPVDPGMLERTRTWLLSRRDGEGGFKRNERALDSFGRAPAQVTDAYITWALSEAGEPAIDKEAEKVVTGALASEDPYVRALAANICWRRDDAARAKDLGAKLARAQAKDGSVPGAETSITRSGGESLTIETTALALLAWLPDADRTDAVERGMQWLLERCKAGRFGSTQATVLALRAIVAYDAARARPAAPGTALLLVDGKVVSEVAFTADAQGAIALPDFAQALSPGEHTVELQLQGGASLPCALAVRYRSPVPASSAGAKIGLSTSLVDSEVTEGEATEIQVRLENLTDEGQPMTVAVVGIPGGLEVRTDRLEELKRGGAFDFVETRGRELVLYWRDLAPNAVKDVTISVVATVPGVTTGPASRAYLYYTDEDKRWVPELTVTVPPR